MLILFAFLGCKLEECNFWYRTSCNQVGSWKSYVCYWIIWVVILDSRFVKVGILCWKKVKTMHEEKILFVHQRT